MIKNIIFDWSGVIKDGRRSYYEIVSLMFERLGRKMISKEELRKTFTIPYMDFWKFHFPNITKELQDSLFAEFESQVELAEAYPGAKTLLELLKEKNYKLYVLSSDFYASLLSEAQRYGVEDLFEEIMAEAHDKNTALGVLLKKNNLVAEETIYVGDTSGDVLAGKHNGVVTVGITWGYQDEERLRSSEPDYVIDNLSEIKSLL